MGREIRMVIPNWEHPKDENGHYKPIFYQSFKDAAEEWTRNFLLWQKGEHPDQDEKYPYYWQWDGNPPDENYYLPEFDQEKTWYQVYETVTEGTPVTPPFATKEELIEYLVKYGDDWSHGRGWIRRNAEQFVKDEWALSLVIKSSQEGI